MKIQRFLIASSNMKQISDSEFVKIWEQSSSRLDVARKCSTSSAAAGMRAVKLRNDGVKLKKFPSGRHKKNVDVNDLNEIIEQSR